MSHPFSFEKLKIPCVFGPLRLLVWTVAILSFVLPSRGRTQPVRIDFVQAFEVKVVDMTIGPNGYIYFLHDDATVSIVDTLVNKRSLNLSEKDTRHALGRGRSIAVDPDHNIAIGDEANGYVYLFDHKGHFLRRFGPSDNSDVKLAKPTGLSFDRYGRLFVADKSGSVIIYNNQGVFLGKRSGFDEPIDVSVDGQGHIYVLNSKNPRISVFNSDFDPLNSLLAEEYIHLELDEPGGLFVESDGTVFVTDRKHCTVYILEIPLEPETAPAMYAKFGVKGIGRGEFRNPIAVLVSPRGYLYVADDKNANVQIFSIAGLSDKKTPITYPPLRTIPLGVEWIADVEHTHTPGSQGLRSFSLDSEGNIYCLDTDMSAVSVYTWAGSYVTNFGKEGSDAGRLKRPVGIVWTDQKFLYVVDTGNHRIQQWSESGVFQRQFGKKGEGPLEFNQPFAIARDDQDRLFIADKNNGRIQILTPEGDVRYIESLGGEPLKKPMGIAVGPEGNLFIIEEGQSTIRVAGKDRELKAVIDDKGLNLFSDPVSVSVDTEKYLYVLDAHRGVHMLDHDHQPILSFSSSGEHIGQFRRPTQVHAGTGERVYISDAVLNRVSIFRMVYRSTGAVSGSVQPVLKKGVVTLFRNGQIDATDSLWYDGSFFVGDVPAGEYTIQVDASGYYQTTQETVSVVPGHIIHSRLIQLEANGSIAGMIVPAVMETRVRLKKDHRFIGNLLVDNEEGRFTFQDIRPGEYELEILSQGYTSRRPLKRILVSSGETLTDTTLLKRPGSIIGTVLPPDAGTVVTVFQDSTEMARIAVRPEDGTFEAGHLYPGLYSLLFQTEKYHDHRMDELEIGEDFERDIGEVELKPLKRTTLQAFQLIDEGKRLHLNADFDRAQTVFLEAITTQEMADEDLAEAYLWLAYSYFPFPELATQKEEALRKSIQLDPEKVLGEGFSPEFLNDFERLKEQIHEEE